MASFPPKRESSAGIRDAGTSFFGSNGPVMPAKAGIQIPMLEDWTPACAGVTTNEKSLEGHLSHQLKLETLPLRRTCTHPTGALTVHGQEPALQLANTAGAKEGLTVQYRRAAAMLRVAHGFVADHLRTRLAGGTRKALAGAIVSPWLSVTKRQRQ
jgi:hypothetical protein